MALNLWAFAAIAVPLVATPGASTAVVLRNALAGGVRSGVATAIGANTGSICYGLLVAFGVSVALQRWPPVWIALRVYTRQSARADGGAIYTVLTRRLREAGAAGITTVRGEWGFSSDERPFGDRFGTIASHVPTYTVLVDRPGRIAELWPIVDEITAEHGVVTAAFVPAYRERAGQEQHGRLAVRSAEDVAALYRAHAVSGTAQTPAVSARAVTDSTSLEDQWARSLTEQIQEFAETHDRPQPLVRATLTDGEQFFLAALEPRPGDGFVTLHPHPKQAADLVAGREGSVLVPRSVVVPLSGIAKVELLTHVPRGTRSNVGFLLPTQDTADADRSGPRSHDAGGASPRPA